MLNDNLSYSELRDAIDGIYAYDSGCVDSGIHDESLRQQVIEVIKKFDESSWRYTLSRIVIDLFLSPAAISQGYGPEDAKALLEWFEDQGVLTLG